MTDAAGDTATPPGCATAHTAPRSPREGGADRRQRPGRDGRRRWASSLLALAMVLGVTLLSPGAAFAASYTDVVDMTFPTDPGVTFIDDFDFGRSGGRTHKATDLMGEKMMPVYAAVGGEVTWAPGADGEGQPSYGYMITILGDDGREYSYVHLNNDNPGTDDGAGGPEQAFAPGIARDAVVQRGDLIGWMGDSGNAESTPPHVHFSIIDPNVSDPYGTSNVNPYFSLLDAIDRGDFATGDVPERLDDGASRSGDEPADEAAPSPAPEESEADAEADETEEPEESEAPEAEEAPAPSLGGGDDVPAERVAGDDRIGTSVALSAAAFDAADHAVLASAFAFSDGVVAGPLAAAVDGPMLTTDADALDERVADELTRLGVDEVTLVGGEMALGPAVAEDLERLGVEVDRLSGEFEVDTAAAVAERVWELNGAETGERAALVALGSHPEPVKAWPDALAAGWHGAVDGDPVLLVRQGEATQATLDALEGVSSATLIGGEAAIGFEVDDEITEVGVDTRRLAGDDRFATAVSVAEDLEDRSPSVLWAATGYDFADALASAPAIARTGDVFLLVDGAGGGADGGLDGWIDEHGDQVEEIRVLGGEAAVEVDAVDDLQDRLGE